jgi:hypothetical protein
VSRLRRLLLDRRLLAYLRDPVSPIRARIPLGIRSPMGSGPALRVPAAGAPSATATAYRDQMDFLLETGTTANSTVLTIYAKSGNASDAVVIEPGSSCGWLQ